MNKRRLLAAMLLWTMVSLNTQGMAATHDTDVSEVINKNYDGYVTQGNGGAITNTISSVIKESTFTNNRAENYGAGGAVDLNTASDTLTQIINSHFDNNYSNWDGGAVAQRRNSGALEISGGSYTNNSAEYEGGALFLGSNANVTSSIDKVIFEGNKTLSTNWNDKYSTADDGGGGAIFVGSKANVNISNSAFKNNESGTVGGAIAVRNDSLNNGSNSLNVTNSNFTENKAVKDGGAIASFIDFKVSNSTFDGNTANRNGGAISLDLGNPNSKAQDSQGSVFENVVFNNNHANSLGGAIYNGKDSVMFVTGIFNENTAQHGGAIFNETGAETTIGSDSVFSNNSALKGGGAIKNYTGGELKINDGVIFSENTSEAGGGAIQNMGNAVLGNNLVFNNNKAAWGGGAIYGGSRAGIGSSTIIGDNAVFTNNTITNTGTDADAVGGAIYIENDENQTVGFTLGKNAYFGNNSAKQGGAIYLNNGSIVATIGEGATFEQNTATEYGGAIFTRTALDIQGATFANNSAGIQGGAIITTRTATGLLNIDSSKFIGNTAGAEGGAIWSGAKTNIVNTLFKDNKTTGTIISSPPDYQNDNEGGGAVFIGSNSVTTIDKSAFINNQSGTVGGAVATRSNAKNDGTTSLAITSSNFDGNKATVNGGALASYIDTTLTDTNFTNNTAGSKGGAVWSNQNLTVNAVNADVVMSNNTAADGGDIYMNTSQTDLNMNAADGKSITIASGISGKDYNMIVNANNTDTGSVIVNSVIQNAAIAVKNGTFHLAQGSTLNNSTLNMAGGTTLNTINNQISDFGNNITLADNTNLAVDVNLANGKADNFAASQVQGKITVTDINKLGNTTANNVSINLADALGINPGNMAISQALQSQTQTILTPIRYLQGGVSENGMLTMAPTGNGYKDFNPAVMASPVAAQLGGYLTQLNSYDEAFRNMDMYMLMTRKQREAMKLRNKYAAADGNLIFDPINTPYSDKAIWFRPYATFENVPLKNGPKVSNVAYGSFFGGESELYDLGHGWDGMIGAYVGYNGSHQAYDGIGIYQNGGTLGLVGMAYKGNFFTGLTVNAGANAGEASTVYGTDNFAMLMAGIASKTGYNWELADGKFIIQPNFLMSYSFVNTFDYTNAAGVRMDSDPLNAIQIEPGLKFIGNLKNGWQPYLGVSMVWNIIDKTNFQANDVSLPELSVKPFFKYGLGVRKIWGERCIGFIQAYFTNGGRNGVGLQAGFRYALGKNTSGSLSANNKTPELTKTHIKLGNVR